MRKGGQYHIHDSWCTPIFTTLLKQLVGNLLRNVCVHFVAEGELRGRGIDLDLLSDAVYEAV